MSNLLFYAPFKSKSTTLGVEVTATVNIWKIARADGTKTSVISSGATTYVGDGIRQYLLTDADLDLYDYVGSMLTADTTVADRQPACLWTRFDESSVARFAGLTTGQAAILEATQAAGISAEDLTELLRAAGLIQIPVNPAAPSSIDAGTITIKRGDSFATSFEMAASASGYDKLWMTFKRDKRLSDDEAVLQFIADTGLTRLNGAAATASDGSITLGADGVTLAIALDEAVTAQLIATNNVGGYWDVQLLKSGVVTTIAEGIYKVTADVTQAIA